MLIEGEAIAEDAGIRQTMIPSLGSPARSLKGAACGHGTLNELTENFGKQLELDSGDGSEPTPGSRAFSWASQLSEEEEHEAKVWSTGLLPLPGSKGLGFGAVVAPSSEKPDDSVIRPKKKKNKKNKGNKAPESSEGDLHSSPSSADQKSEELSQSTEERVLDVDSTTADLEIPVSSLRVEGSCKLVSENVDKKAPIIGEGVVTCPVKSRVKVTNNTVWAMKRLDCRVLPGSSWQPVGAKDAPRPNECGWQSATVKYTGKGFSGSSRVPLTRVEVEEDLGWHVCDTVADPTSNTLHSSNGKWDEPMAEISWDSCWEAAGCRPGNKGEDWSSKLPVGGPNASPNKTKGGRGQPNSTGYGKRGVQQRPYEREKTSRNARSSGHAFEEKGGRPSPRTEPGLSKFGTPRQPPTQLHWGKPFKESTNNSLDWDAAAVVQGTNCANSGSSVSSASILGNLLPHLHLESKSNPGIQSLIDSSISLDCWKGGSPPFSGKESSVCEDYQASLYSDSQWSDDDHGSDTVSLASFESHDSHKSHSTQRMSKWFRNFFQGLDILTDEQLHENDRRWHCPACQGGVGAIDWYRGLQPLLAHAKTVRSKRAKLHKSFAAVLEEEIRIRGAAPGKTHGSGKHGNWRGLGDKNENIVWPPMVVIRNTQLEQDEDDKWIGMGNNELLDLFKKYNPVKARHSYGPQGHRGMSILIFAESPTGYYNAQRLQTQFIEARRGKDNWEAAGKLLFQQGGERILYGYMAMADDLEMFNKHNKGKLILKWDLKSFQDMVLSPMRKLDEEKNTVTILEGILQRGKEIRRTLKKTVFQISKKLEMREEELTVIRDRAREQHEKQETQMEDMEEVYKEKIQQLKKEILEKENSLQKVHEEYKQEHKDQCEKLQQKVSKIPKDEDLSEGQQLQPAFVAEEIVRKSKIVDSVAEEIVRKSKIVEIDIKNQEVWEASKGGLLKEHHQKMMEFKARQWEDLIKFELKLDRERVEVFQVPKNIANVISCK